ncbi:MAG: PAS domain S-box protein [Woeseiaceae bacterium]|nr:PAS domain S-box protein [Woeseiaceae bacterium]
MALASGFWLLGAIVSWATGAAPLSAFAPDGAMLVERALGVAAIAAVSLALISYFRGSATRSEREAGGRAAQCRRVLDSTFDSVLFLDRDAKIVAANKSAQNTLGLPAGTLEGRLIDSLIVEIDDGSQAADVDLTARLLAEPQLLHGPMRAIVNGQDGMLPAEISIHPNEGGDDATHFLILREIRERVDTEQALKRSEDEYRRLFEQSPIGVFRNLPDGTILNANHATLDILGIESIEELTGNWRMQDFYADPAERRDVLRKLLGTGTLHSIQLEIRRPDGELRTVLSSGTCITNDPEHDVIIQATLQDITDLRETQDALKDSDETLRTLAENALDMVLIVDKRGKILYCSPSGRRFTGIEPAELLGRHVSDLAHKDDRPAVSRAMKLGRRNIDKPTSLNCRVQRADGSIVITEAISRTFEDSTGRLRTVINVRDVGERQRTAVQLQQAQKMQAVGQLTGGIAHDFNNLLMVIVGNLQLLREQSLDPKTCAQIDQALQACVRGGDLTRRLLALARRQPLEPRIVDVNKLLASIDPLLQRSLSKSMRIRNEYTDEPWLTKVDPSLLESALLNLAINSRDAMSGEGLLTVRTFNKHLDPSVWPELSDAESGDFVCIEVSDDGVGMDVEVLKRAVDPFFTTKKECGGSGLGLSMVYGFVQQSGGHMRIESERGTGTRVEIYLPRTDEIERHEAASSDELEMPFGGESVLVVDDNDQVRDSAAALIKRLGYRVRKASSAQRALRMLQDEQADLLFSDIMMPEMSGFDLADKVTKERPDVTILLTTGFADDSILNGAEDRDRYDILYKPYNQIELAKRIRSALDKHNEQP